MWCIFKKLRGYLLVLQMCQLPVSGPLRQPGFSMADWLITNTVIIARQTQSHQVDEKARNTREYNLLAGHLHGSQYTV